MRAELLRFEKSKKGVFGVLKIDGKSVCLILERPWENNEPNISCIPDNIYVCKRVDSPKYGDTFEVQGVPSRTNILFHWGNTIENSLGCLLTGSSMGELDGERAVLNSKDAFHKFMSVLDGVDYFPFLIRSI